MYLVTAAEEDATRLADERRDLAVVGLLARADDRDLDVRRACVGEISAPVPSGALGVSGRCREPDDGRPAARARQTEKRAERLTLGRARAADEHERAACLIRGDAALPAASRLSVSARPIVSGRHSPR